MDNKPLTVREAAEYLSITPHHLRTFLREKKLKAYKVGHWLIYPKDLEEFIKKTES